jgi:hypothetical protein
MIVLLDDLNFAKPDVCDTVPTITDASFGSGKLAAWNFYWTNGDEIFESSTAQHHTGTRSAKLTFPSIYNSASISRSWTSCVGDKFIVGIWILTPIEFQRDV